MSSYHHYHTSLTAALVEVVVRLVDVHFAVAEDAVHPWLKLQLWVDRVGGVFMMWVIGRCTLVAGVRAVGLHHWQTSVVHEAEHALQQIVVPSNTAYKYTKQAARRIGLRAAKL